jgi:hypothetical protein
MYILILTKNGLGKIFGGLKQLLWSPWFHITTSKDYLRIQDNRQQLIAYRKRFHVPVFFCLRVLHA